MARLLVHDSSPGFRRDPGAARRDVCGATPDFFDREDQVALEGWRRPSGAAFRRHTRQAVAARAEFVKRKMLEGLLDQAVRAHDKAPLKISDDILIDVHCERRRPGVGVPRGKRPVPSP